MQRKRLRQQSISNFIQVNIWKRRKPCCYCSDETEFLLLNICQWNVFSRFLSTFYVQDHIQHFLNFNDIFILLNCGLSASSTPLKSTVSCVSWILDVKFYGKKIQCWLDANCRWINFKLLLALNLEMQTSKAKRVDKLPYQTLDMIIHWKNYIMLANLARHEWLLN